MVVDNQYVPSALKGTRCLESGELVYEQSLKPFVIKCIW